jgi:thymidylate synthase
MNNLDKQYQSLLQDILDNGVTKQDRTGTGTISVFGRQIRHKMSDGFPLLTTKKMAWKSIVTELLWFLRGDTNIKFLVDNDCHIWDGDAYKNYEKWWKSYSPGGAPIPLSKEKFINKIKTDQMFAFKWGELGPIYGAQWRRWFPGGKDQIQNLINDLKTNPDSRRLMVNAWNVGELDQMVLPPCHYSWQVYTRELSLEERIVLLKEFAIFQERVIDNAKPEMIHSLADSHNIPTRAISLMWNQRSVDTFLGLPFNIASYGLLLEIIAKTVNMVPDELIGNLGDVHLYSNHVEQAKEQIGRELTWEERKDLLTKEQFRDEFGYLSPFVDPIINHYLDSRNIPKRTREPFPLPTLNINTEFWPYEGGSCGEGLLDAIMVFEAFKNDNFCKCLLEEDIQLSNYQSHPAIKAPLSN